MNYNQKGYEVKMTLAVECLYEAITLTHSSLEHFSKMPQVINKYEILATTAFSKIAQLKLTDTKFDSIVKNGFIIYEVVSTILNASNSITKDQPLFSKAVADGIEAVNKLQEAAVHLSALGGPIVEYVTSYFYSNDQHESLSFDNYTPNSTSSSNEYKLAGSTPQLIVVEG